MTGWILPQAVTTRTERHFGDRFVRCFAARPASVRRRAAAWPPALPRNANGKLLKRLLRESVTP